MNLLRKLDYSSTHVTFFYKGKKNVESAFGGLLSIISAILLMLLVIRFGRDFYLRINPYVYFSTLDTGEYQNLTITPENFTLAFRFEDSNSIMVDPEGLSYYFEVYYENYVRNLTTGQFKMVNQTILPYRSCNIKDVNFEDFRKKDYEYFFCIDYEEMQLGGFWDTYFVNFFYINYYKCNYTNPHNNKICNSVEVTNSLIEGPIYVSFLLPDTYYNQSNYNEPFTKKVRSEYYILDESLQKDAYFKLATSQVENDYGWILENFLTVTAINYFSHTVDYNMNISILKDENYYLGAANFYLKRELQINHRVYNKIQELIASIGGVFKGVTILVTFFSELYNESQLEVKLLSKIIKSESTVKISSMNLSKDVLLLKGESNRDKHLRTKKNNFIKITADNRDLVSLDPLKKRIERNLENEGHNEAAYVIMSKSVWQYIICSKCFACSSYKSLCRLRLKLISRLSVEGFIKLTNSSDEFKVRQIHRSNEGCI